jgi:chromosome segregation ATPase
MEDELKLISAELATSIRREMELEDLVDRLQSEAANPQGPGKRTSDYFSDSGTSSVKYGGETDVRSEELDRMQRRTEREKAQIRLELTDKVQEERSRRKVLESQIRSLEERASQVSLFGRGGGGSITYANILQADLNSMNSLDASGRLRDLENTCEDLRRRLNEERQVKDNFEDLLGALRSELENSHNERDNLRDEIVPQLRARVEGLEAQAAEHEKLTYENTKMQQEMQTLKNENNTLINARKLQVDMQQQGNKFNTISEESSAVTPPAATGGLSRSNTVSHISSSRAARPSSLSRSNSVKTSESREVLADRVKDIEAQRDALHRALKSLLERQELQNRENQKRIKQLEMERDRALTTSPGRVGYDKEVANLREEINTLRRRADEAIEQKWQCEKGLSGLKMDLDRAEQEISSLRGMLKETDASIPGGRGNRSSVTSDSLARSYRDLQTAYATSLERVQELERSTPKDPETESALRALQASLSAAINERDFAVSESEDLRNSISSLQETEKSHMDSEVALADDLRASAKRVEELATQVRQQLTTNATLRQRLAETIDRGEKEQKSNAARIVFMQGKLRSLEEELVGAQQTSEDKISKHEDELKNLKQSHNTQLQRMRDGLKSPRLFGPKSPMSPLFASTRSPRISRTTSGPGISVSQESQVALLKGRVMELEKALEEADKEMEEVVGRMNSAQIEVMELWNEREEAVRVTKRLEREIEEERRKGFESRFKTLSS